MRRVFRVGPLHGAIVKGDEPLGGGLPDAGGLNIDYTEPAAFEPTEDQVEMVQRDLETIAEGVRAHLTDGFTVTTRVTRAQGGSRGVVVVAFPTGDAIGPGVRLTADMFETVDGSNGPIPPDEIEALSRRITTMAVTQWAEMTGLGDDERAFPAQ